MINKAEFQNNAYMVTFPVNAPTCRSANHHSKQDFDQAFGTNIGKSQFPGILKMEIVPGTDTVWLPYTQDGIDSVRLPSTAGPSFFVTANLSGCAVYIGINDLNRYVVFHANSQSGSSQAEMAHQKPSYQSDKAVKELDNFCKVAQTAHHNNCKIVGVLSKARYLACVNKLAKTGDDFLGGTTVAGWRTGGNWEFWYQVWGSVNKGAVGLIHVEQFYP